MADPRHGRLVDRVHARLAEGLSGGDIALDATVGGGRDTRFLAEAVGEAGCVYGFDIQPEALAQARRRLGALASRVQLLLRGHETLLESLPAGVHGRLAVAVFNLGFLPGGDARIITRTQTTLRALDAALTLLAPGGLLSVVAYPGHPGGGEECEAVMVWAELRRSEGCGLEVTVPAERSGPSPQWRLIQKPAAGILPVESTL